VTLKDQLRNGDRLLGVLLRIPAEELVEMCAVAGFDFVLIDCEHGPADLVPLRQHLAVTAAYAVPTLVRVGSAEPALVLRALDAGAAGIVAPHIDTPAQAAALVDSAHYPPLGHRGFATYSRAGRYGQVDPQTHQERRTAETLVIGMIESPEGVDNCRDILHTAGLDGIMIGTADLRASSTATDPAPSDSIRAVHDLLAERGRVRMDIVNGPDQAQRSFADGATMVVYNLTHAIMEHLAVLSSARPAPPPDSAP
jgi:4-hydroxy-2-oxoheptanedioate aldolase